MPSRNFCDCCDEPITVGGYGSIKIEGPQYRASVPSVHKEMVCDRCIVAIAEAVKRRSDKKAA